MPSPFETCPTEVVCEIVSPAISNLRLSCKKLAAKADASAHTQARFTSKHVDLTEQALQTFAEGTQAGGLRCLVQNLTLSGAVVTGVQAPRTRTWEQRALASRENKISLLGHAFAALAKYSRAGMLTSLSLEVAIPPELRQQDRQYGRPPFPYAEDVWKPIWTAAVDTFHIVFGALDKSRLRIQNLNIYNSAGQQRCSLPCDALSRVAWDRQPGLAESLSSVRSLSISLSNRVFRADEDGLGRGATQLQANDRDQDLAVLYDDRNFRGLAGLIQLLKKQLKVFEWHYFRLHGELHDPDFERRIEQMHARLLSEVVKLDNLPSLTRCTLRGLYATPADLLGFVKRTRVTELSLEHIRLISGTFRRLFDYCTSAEAPITRLSCFDLGELGAPVMPSVLFSGPDSAVGIMWWSLDLDGDGVKQPISYRTQRGPIDTPITRVWRAAAYREYGTY